MDEITARAALAGALHAVLPGLRRFARALTGHPEDADDLVQLGLERAFQRVDQWDRSRPLAGWMYGILRNAWFDELRRRRRMDGLFVDVDVELLGVDPAAGVQAAMGVEAALSRLPPEQRLVVVLVLVEGLSYQEAADIAGVPVGTVTSRLARARSALQVLMGED
ncbi:MAG: RNA polymerase sigma factor [Lysobacteraceae bacterium]